MEKTLLNMPPKVRASALIARGTWYSRPLIAVQHRMSVWFQVVTALAKWAVMIWWLLGLTSIFEEAFAKSVPSQLTFFAGLLFVASALYVLDLLFHMPMSERGWPCIAPADPSLFAGDLRNNSFREAFAFGAAWPALIFGVLLATAAGYQWQKHGILAKQDLLYSGTSFVIAAIALLLDRFPPKFGLKVPTWAEFHAARDNHAQRQASAQVMQSGNRSESQDYQLPVAATVVNTSFATIFGMQALKDKLLEPARNVMSDRVELKDDPRNGILLHGEPGNGKTVFAEALAGELKVPFIQVTYGDVSSKWVGEMPRVISNVFAYAKRAAPCVLFIDEIDSFITSRDQSSGNSEDLKITNTLLTEIVNLRSHKVVLVGATNYLKNLDAAAIREGRFDFKVEVTPPDEPARIGLLDHGLKKYAPSVSVDEEVLKSVAKRWNGFSVSRLMAVTKAIPSVMQGKQGQSLSFDSWMIALREVQGRNGRVPVDTKALSELILPDDTKEATEMVASRLRDVLKIESFGGTLPTGVLFHGPSGTGKTAAARALAKEAGWAFLSVAGPDLLADRKALDRLFAEAKDLRPTIVFIDEADDVLRNRQFSSTPDLCNKLLVLMDGADERVKDVVVIAATNNPDQIDPALLRSGRFTEKVEFAPPPSSELPRFLSGWVKAKRVALADELDVIDLADIFQGRTIADIEGALQYALNKAIADHGGEGRLQITREHVKAASRVVLAA